MTNDALARPSVDPVSDTLKWILLVVAILCFATLAWATVVTYREAPPIPDAIVGPSGQALMTADDIVGGKGGFQKADLMDYGSIYGMGSYFGEDYTASTLVALGADTRAAIAQADYGKPFDGLAPEQQVVATQAMRDQLQKIDLTQSKVAVSDGVGKAIAAAQSRITATLSTEKLAAGWVPPEACLRTSPGRPPISSSIRR